MLQTTLSFFTILIIDIAGILYIASYFEKRMERRRQFVFKRQLDAAKLKLNNDRREARDAFELWWEAGGKQTAEQFVRNSNAMFMTDEAMSFDDVPEFAKDAARTIMVALIEEKVASYAIYLMTVLSLERVQALMKVMAAAVGEEAKYESQARQHAEALRRDELSLIQWGYDLDQFQAHFTQKPVK